LVSQFYSFPVAVEILLFILAFGSEQCCSLGIFLQEKEVFMSIYLKTAAALAFMTAVSVAPAMADTGGKAGALLETGGKAGGAGETGGKAGGAGETGGKSGGAGETGGKSGGAGETGGKGGGTGAG
jgi:hypothetical protein